MRTILVLALYSIKYGSCAECHYAEFCYDKCQYAECCYALCRGTTFWLMCKLKWVHAHRYLSNAQRFDKRGIKLANVLIPRSWRQHHLPLGGTESGRTKKNVKVHISLRIFCSKLNEVWNLLIKKEFDRNKLVSTFEV